MRATTKPTTRGAGRTCGTCGRSKDQHRAVTVERTGLFGRKVIRHEGECDLRLLAEKTAVDLKTGERVTTERYVPEQGEPRPNRAMRRGRGGAMHAVVQRTAANRASWRNPSTLSPVEDRRARLSLRERVGRKQVAA